MPDAEPVAAAAAAAAAAAPASPAVTRSFKSFKKDIDWMILTVDSSRRKYGKQKIKFEAVMKDSTALAREEMRIHDLSKRLREQNDQLLELLLELNNTVHIPRSLRYDLNKEEDSQLHTTMSDQPDSIPIVECDAQTARAKLNEAKQKLLAGEMTADECKELELSMLKSNTFAPTASITSLLKNVPHTTPSSDDATAQDNDLEASLGFIHPEDDVDYLIPSEPRRIDLTNARSTSKHLPVADREKALLIRNPSSVYNWLRKNKPQVFAHDPEAPPAGTSSANAAGGGSAQSEKPAAASRPSSTRSKRASAQAPKEEEVYDEDGVLVDVVEPAANAGSGGSRAKRKREEDGVYHPKGGNRGRKKRDDKRAKRPSTASTAAAS
ncbi:uncharacterized protein ARB_02477 [Trichophyton benhamiae CBS 112371]|uniref:IEC3 subunit of the Ino80 complex, chromatin re-modelling-domain-containing protein n=1 Tax=Arthroderma benhamiae (strain ATCC MYA-4681 / CBS 112371) TaxID=663331 RepID=D4B1Z6_ARTBC|nr:uncharacterized protein ARB_02477 [Trichophyton benhamiae CBS 112371]EFE30557.1 conserved hypothetical protein [Trichophyton benhamiae CBS 112371]